MSNNIAERLVLNWKYWQRNDNIAERLVLYWKC